MLRFGELRFGRVGPFCCPAALQQGNPLTSGCTWRHAALGPEGSTQTNAVRTPTVTWTPASVGQGPGAEGQGLQVAWIGRSMPCASASFLWPAVVDGGPVRLSGGGRGWGREAVEGGEVGVGS